VCCCARRWNSAVALEPHRDVEVDSGAGTAKIGLNSSVRLDRVWTMPVQEIAPVFSHSLGQNRTYSRHATLESTTEFRQFAFPGVRANLLEPSHSCEPNMSGQSGPSCWSRVENVATHGLTVDRATVRQKKTSNPIRFELSEQTREVVNSYIQAANKKPSEFLFASRHGRDSCMTTRQYARLVSQWIASIGLDPSFIGTHSLRRTKATLIYRRTGNLCAVQLQLGHTKIESTVRYLGVEVDDALTISDQVEV
jgi:Phage integrase family